MTIIGFNFKKLEAEKKEMVRGKINVSNNVSINQVDEKKLPLSSDKQKVLAFTFEFTSKYDPDIGSIKFVGDVLFMDEAKKVKEIRDDYLEVFYDYPEKAIDWILNQMDPFKEAIPPLRRDALTRYNIFFSRSGIMGCTRERYLSFLSNFKQVADKLELSNKRKGKWLSQTKDKQRERRSREDSRYFDGILNCADLSRRWGMKYLLCRVSYFLMTLAWHFLQAPVLGSIQLTHTLAPQ